MSSWGDGLAAYMQALDQAMQGGGTPQRGSDASRRRATVAGINPQEPAPGKEAGALEAMMIPGAPVKAILGGLGAAYGVAAGIDSGLFSTPAEAQRKGQAAALPEAPAGLPPQFARRWQELTARQTKDRWLPPAERTELQDLNKAAIGAAGVAASGAAKSKTEEYDRSVRKAETERDLALRRDRRFSDTAIGQVWDKTGGAAPVVAGGVAGALGRIASGGGSALKNYVMPMGEGALAGITAANIPLAYNAFNTEPDNPQRTAYQAYARELPPDHPRKAEWQSYASQLPEANPVRVTANNELFDRDQMLKRIFFGGLEGAGGALIGASAVRAPGAMINGLLARNGNTGGPTKTGGGAGGPEVPPPDPVPTSYSQYSQIPETLRGSIQDAYLASRGMGGNVPPREGAAAMKGTLAAHDINVPITPQRVNATNQSFDAFVAQNGRLPTQAERSMIFNNKTLSIPLGAIPAAGAAGYYGSQEQPNLLAQYLLQNGS